MSIEVLKSPAEAIQQESPTDGLSLLGASAGSRLVVLSLGAGVQSSTLALMAAHGELDPMPHCAIFSDTGAEPKPVYEWLDKLEEMMPFPLHRVQWAEGLLKNIKGAVKGGQFAGAPFDTENDDFNRSDKEGQLRRQCTREFKVQPITRKLRELCGLAKGERAGKESRVLQYIGISLDEIVRMKPSRDKWIEHQWPLIDKRMSRWDCMRWLEKNGYPVPPKSSCTFCPYHSNHEWRWLKATDPEGWQQAVDIDNLIRGGVRGTKHALYLHRDMVPLEEVDLSTDTERGQMGLWGNECEGMCGV
jgi:hypothetical protein